MKNSNDVIGNDITVTENFMNNKRKHEAQEFYSFGCKWPLQCLQKQQRSAKVLLSDLHLTHHNFITSKTRFHLACYPNIVELSACLSDCLHEAAQYVIPLPHECTLESYANRHLRGGGFVAQWLVPNSHLFSSLL
jgi:hypothetical protein